MGLEWEKVFVRENGFMLLWKDKIWNVEKCGGGRLWKFWWMEKSVLMEGRMDKSNCGVVGSLNWLGFSSGV